jgi:hypothetical protein
MLFDPKHHSIVVRRHASTACYLVHMPAGRRKFFLIGNESGDERLLPYSLRKKLGEIMRLHQVISYREGNSASFSRSWTGYLGQVRDSEDD